MLSYFLTYFAFSSINFKTAFSLSHCINNAQHPMLDVFGQFKVDLHPKKMKWIKMIY